VACETICTFFLRFFSKSKKHDFLRFFELLHTFSPTVALTAASGTTSMAVFKTQLVYKDFPFTSV